ncbi:hypothetical protein B0H14DRAFT_2637181 [Mycena olivaceomarginata]|nr:hypothetical protein B0H14DRAFT_2637181 [Mycena olivaceomarginata]
MAPNAVSMDVSVLKRRCKDTAGGSIPTATFYSDGTLPSTMFASGNASSAPKVVSTDQAFTMTLSPEKHAIPSPHMVSSFAEIHLKSLNDYKGVQSSLQRATATSNGFALSSSGGTPTVVTNHLKLPSYQLVKSVPSVDEDPRVTMALRAANKSLAAAHVAATALLSTVYSVQVKHCRQLTNASTCVDRFAADLTTYCQNVVRMSGFEDVDRYEIAIAMLKRRQKLSPSPTLTQTLR